VHVQAAFFFGGVFPPPAAGAKILAGADGPGAWRTADADKALVVQRIVGNVVLPYVVPDLLERPVEQRVKLDQLVRRIPFKRLHVEAVGRLLSANAGDPDFLPFQGAAERLNFAYLAAFLAVLHRVIKTVGAFPGQHVFHGPGLRIKHFDRLAVAVDGAGPGSVSLLKIATGIEGKNPDRELVGKNQVTDYLVFQTETGAERHRAGELPGQEGER